MKKTPFLIITAILLACTAFLPFWIHFSGRNAKKEETGTLSVTVVDGFRREPVPNCRVICAETGADGVTDAAGNVRLSLPILKENLPHRITPEWGTVTLLFYAEDHAPTVLRNTAVYPDTERPLTAEVFRLSDLPTDNAVIVSDPPPVDWTETLLQYYLH